MFKDAAIGGAGAVVMDVVMGQLNTYLPASLQTQKTTLSIGDAVKAGLTAALGKVLAKHTKGLSLKMAEGALAVQAYEIISGFLPTTMALGYMSPAAIVNGSNRVGPTQGGMLQGRRHGMRAYLPAGRNSNMLNAYLQPGNARITLNGPRQSVQMREGVSTYR